MKHEITFTSRQVVDALLACPAGREAITDCRERINVELVVERDANDGTKPVVKLIVEDAAEVAK